MKGVMKAISTFLLIASFVVFAEVFGIEPYFCEHKNITALILAFAVVVFSAVYTLGED